MSVFAAFAQNFAMLLVGRVLTGLCCGITSLTVPTYIGEYSSSDIRGTLGEPSRLHYAASVFPHAVLLL